MAADLAFKISPENLITDFSDFESWANGTSVAPDGWTATGTAGSIARESTNIKFGTYSMKIISGSSSTYAAEYVMDFLGKTLYREGRDISYLNYLPGRTITFGCWVMCSSASKARIYVNDGFTTTTSSFHTGGGTFEFLTVTVQINASSTQIKFGCQMTNNTVTGYFDSAIVCEGEATYTQFRGSNIYVRETDWDNQVTFSVGSFTIPRKEGSQIPAVLMREGRIRLKVQIHNTDFPSARAMYDAIIAAVSDGMKDLQFSDDRVIKVWLSNLPRLDFMAAAQVYVFDLQFTSPQPMSSFVSALRNKQNITASPTSFNFAVSGSLKSFPIVYFLPATGITISSLTLENLTTGERFSFLDTVGPGGTMMFDFDKLNFLKNGIDGSSYFTGDFLKLAPGVTNYFKYTGTTGVTIYTQYKPKYIS